jgi:hypothetical protein
MGMIEKINRIRVVADAVKTAIVETSGHLSDVSASALPVGLFPVWSDLIGQSLANNVIVSHGGKLYRTMQTLTVQQQYAPGAGMESLYKEITFSGGDGIPDWVQPLGATDAYGVGDKVRYNGQVWISTVASNVWSPDVYGWSLF